MVLFAVLLIWQTAGIAGEQRRIELQDGGLIFGEIVAFANGVYTINSPAFVGKIKIKDDKIKAIRSPQAEALLSEQADALSKLGLASEFQSLQDLVANNKEVMTALTTLQNDPQFQAVLQDKDVMNAVMSGNFGALLNNPSFMKLLEHKKVQEIAKDIEAEQQQ
jgi:hypothetical protein